MTDLSSAIGDYLTVRRALGHKMEMAERLLGQFDLYYERAGATQITNDLALAWATLPVGASAGWWASGSACCAASRPGCRRWTPARKSRPPTC